MMKLIMNESHVKKLVRDVDYFVENDRVIFTKKFHIERRQCCGNGCRHCPYEPKHIKNNKKLES